MRELGNVNIQYAQLLWGPIKKALNVKRDRGDNAKVKFMADDSQEVLILRIDNDVRSEVMTSVSNQGAKKRMDIHIATEHLEKFIEILSSFVGSLSIRFDEASRQSPDPTGMEHPDGLPLGRTEALTWIKTQAVAYFSDEDICIQTRQNAQLYLDAENYARGSRIHFGIRNFTNSMEFNSEATNYIELRIPYTQLKRLLHTIKVGKKWLK